MKKNFSDYPTYAIPETENTENVEEETGKKIIIFSPKSLNEIEKAKLEQIVGAINIKPTEVYYDFSTDSMSSDTLLNALTHEKVSFGICFSPENPEEKLFQVLQKESSSLILSCTIGALIKDEETSVTTRRKALWMAMKNWK